MSKQFKCKECGKVLNKKEILYEKMPSNFHVFGIDNNNVPKCPFCNSMHFLGFEEE